MVEDRRDEYGDPKTRRLELTGYGELPVLNGRSKLCGSDLPTRQHQMLN